MIPSMSFAWSPLTIEAPRPGVVTATAPSSVQLPILIVLAVVVVPPAALFSLKLPLLGPVLVVPAALLGLLLRGQDRLEAGADGVAIVQATPWATKRTYLAWESVAAHGVYEAPAVRDSSEKGTHLWVRPVRPPIGPEPDALVYGEGKAPTLLKQLNAQLQDLRPPRSKERRVG